MRCARCYRAIEAAVADHVCPGELCAVCRQPHNAYLSCSSAEVIRGLTDRLDGLPVLTNDQLRRAWGHLAGSTDPAVIEAVDRAAASAREQLR